MQRYIKSFSSIGIADVAEVGGKNASLGEMAVKLATMGIRVPDGFAVTVDGFKYFVQYNGIGEKLQNLMNSLDTASFSNLPEVGAAARKMFLKSTFPELLSNEILSAYQSLGLKYNDGVAVRSSATAEDLATASFAGQHESYLNVHGKNAILLSIKKCFASLYTDRAIKYRHDNNFKHEKVFLSVGIQIMVNAEKGCSGIGFTIEPETGFKDVVHLAGVWGLGENIVQGTVTPDEFLIFKSTLALGKNAIIEKKLGSKIKMMGYSRNRKALQSTINKDTPVSKRNRFVLDDNEAMELARWAVIIESHYKRPMDIEWAKDGKTSLLYILQARPETIHGTREKPAFKSYRLIKKSAVLAKGVAVGHAITSGRARVLQSPDQAHLLRKGDILVTDVATPDWDPIMKKVSGIITNKGGRTSHAAIVARELGLVAIFGTGNATNDIAENEAITISCAEGSIGYVYQGNLKWEESSIDMRKITVPEKPKPQLIISEPEMAFQLSYYPNYGVGLLRLEFIIGNYISIHPMAVARPNKVLDRNARTEIKKAIQGYKNGEIFFYRQISTGNCNSGRGILPEGSHRAHE